MIKVCEIFCSIQGESTYAGLLCAFVRLAGCNLRCTYCDTQYAWQSGTEMSDKDIIQRISGTGINLVEITGGEPLLQKDVILVITYLLDAGYNVLVETNGSVSIEDVDPRAVIILDIKTPGSGMSDKMHFKNLDIVRQNHEVKFVITGRRDYDWSKEVMKRYSLTERCTVLFSPAYGILEPGKLAEWMITDRSGARLNIQLHKYIDCK